MKIIISPAKKLNENNINIKNSSMIRFLDETRYLVSQLKKYNIDDIKSMMNEIMQIVAEKDKVTQTLESEDVTKRFKEAEKLILPFLYNLMKSEEPYIHWPNRTPIIKAQIEKFLQITRGK